MHTRTIKLSNGSMTVSGDFNLFTLSKEERFYFGEVIDYLGRLESSAAKARTIIHDMNEAIKAQAPPDVEPLLAVPAVLPDDDDQPF